MRVVPFGDAAVSFAFEPRIEPETLARVESVDRALRDLTGVIETVPAYASVLALYDPASISTEALAQTARRADASTPETVDGRLHEIQVAYGGADGPDLGDVAAWAGLPETQVVDLHAGDEYLVYMVGFTPGFPYLGLVAESIAAPRLPRPRARVPAGSVGIARRQTGIYPASTPGGWRLIGRTTVRLFDPRRACPAHLSTGDRVRFVPTVPDALPSPDPLTRPAEVAHDSWPAFAVVRAGVFSTVQDRGRDGGRRFGVPPAGVMDRSAQHNANVAVGNAPGAAVLEFAWPAPVLTALRRVDVAIAGANFGPEVDGAPVPRDDRTDVAMTTIGRGSTLRFRAPRSGFWGYLAIGGAFAVESILGSASTLVRSGFGGHDGRPLRAGDVLHSGRLPWATPPAPTIVEPRRAIRLRPGLHVDQFPAGALERFASAAYRISTRSDRSGYGLAGDPIAHDGPGEILSEGMLPGAVEILPDGQPIVLMPDGPVTGGYPVLAVVTAEDLGNLAQHRPGDPIRFVIV
ncbi:MAG: 5-oxoprolinase subunit PxpB [Armatimonadetes bacterium]|nr:5-oxoprolinase subunit PxpB [Armatimonadota bacterium]